MSTETAVENGGLLCGAVISILLLIASFSAFDTLMRAFHCSHKSLWERAGQPMGFFWRPPELGLGASWLYFVSPRLWFRFYRVFYRSYFAQQRCYFKWTYCREAPDWVAADPQAFIQWKRFKRLTWWCTALSASTGAGLLVSAYCS